MARTDVWVWIGLTWSSRVRLVLDEYGEQITDISLFGWSVAADGTLTETFDPSQLDQYREKWPHIRFWGALRNMDDPDDGPLAIFNALRDSATARNHLADEIQSKMFEMYPYLMGVDVDLESGGDSRSEDSEEIFRVISQRAHDLGKKSSAALPPLTSTGSVGGENWVRYRQLGQILDHVSIMSYDFAWSGSAPGPSSPAFWLRDVYNWVSSQITPSKVSMGLPLYANFWQISDYPDNDTGWRGSSGTYYAAWQHLTGYRTNDGNDANPSGDGSFYHLGWIAYRDEDSKFGWGYLDCYDWLYPAQYQSVIDMSTGTFQSKPYMTRFGTPATVPIGGIVDNSPGDAQVNYEIEPRRVVDRDGILREPKTGYSLTLDLLQRVPVAATIVDDSATSKSQLNQVYVQGGGGDWSYWQNPSNGSNYSQYRGSGPLTYWKDFGSQSLYVQARFQFATSGSFTLKARGITATITSSGTVTLKRGSTTLGTANVGNIPVGGAAAGSSRRVFGLRVRDGSARVYFAQTEANVPRILYETVTSVPGGAPGFDSTSQVWIDHAYLGDGWLYQPREAVQAEVNGESYVLGRIPREGITWDTGTPNTFRPVEDVDEDETREKAISLDWEFGHWPGVPLVTDSRQMLKIIPLDHDTWLGKIQVMDKKRSNIVYFTDQDTIAYWRAQASGQWALSGIALWTVGQEDVRVWDSLKNGELSEETRVLNG